MVAIRGQILGQSGATVPNVRVELWAADDQSQNVGEHPLLTTASQIGGFFRLDLSRLPTGTELPPNTNLVFRDRSGAEIGQSTLSAEGRRGEPISYENSQLAAPRSVQYWPDGYHPLRQVPPDLVDDQRLDPQSGLPLQNTAEVVFLTTFVYLPPLPEYWPWEVGPDEIDYDSQSALEQEYLIGLELTHRQEWQIQGHARGELLHSLPLAPGEETTVEVLTWDRQ
jgi:hypothetical protein